MRATSIIFRRELGAYLRSPVGYVIAALLLLVCGILFQAKALGEGKQLSALVLQRFFEFMSGTTVVAAIALSIRLVAEERQTHTLVLLNTSPVKDAEIILGKFLAAFVFLSGIVLLSLYMPLLIQVNGKITTSQIAVGYMGLFLIGAASLAIGIFASALSRHQLVAAFVGAALAGIMYLLYELAKKLPAPLSSVFQDLGLWHVHFAGSFMQGVFSLKDAVYYAALTYFFLLLAIKTMEAKRWQ
ncbi:MAG TPA: ABC transporter permease [Kofleriaceae bacterium]|nr:ABC transporter permease [Kofleriaceae bacterium]